MLNTMELLVLSTALGADLFSVAVPIGMKKTRWSKITRAAVVFAVFHIVMILAGYYLGGRFGLMIENFEASHLSGGPNLATDWAKIIGAGVLMVIGIHMIKENLSGGESRYTDSSILEGTALLVLAVGVSLDALAAGFSLGVMEVDLVKLSLILGLTIFLIAVIGLGLGRRVGRLLGSKSELIGGVMLILLGVHVVWLTM